MEGPEAVVSHVDSSARQECTLSDNTKCGWYRDKPTRAFGFLLRPPWIINCIYGFCRKLDDTVIIVFLSCGSILTPSEFQSF